MQGFRGPQGEMGDEGIVLMVIVNGSIGEKGQKGDLGPPGLVGPPGDTGLDGPQGSVGEKGPTGTYVFLV